MIYLQWLIILIHDHSTRSHNYQCKCNVRWRPVFAFGLILWSIRNCIWIANSLHMLCAICVPLSILALANLIHIVIATSQLPSLVPMCLGLVNKYRGKLLDQFGWNSQVMCHSGWPQIDVVWATLLPWWQFQILGNFFSSCKHVSEKTTGLIWLKLISKM